MSSEELSLTWGDHHSTLVGVFEKLLESSTLVDCTIAAEGQYLKAHKVVLSACSPYFELLFSQENERNPIVILKDIKFQELKSMIDFIYRGKVKIPENRLEDFIEAAESLQIKGLGGGQKVDSLGKRVIVTQSSQKREGQSPLVPRKRRRVSSDENRSASSPKFDVNSESNSCESLISHPDPTEILSVSQTEITSPIVTLTTGPDLITPNESDQSNSATNTSTLPTEGSSKSGSEKLFSQCAPVIKTEPEPVSEIFLTESDCFVDPKKEVCMDDMSMMENDGISAVMEYVQQQQQQSTNQYCGASMAPSGGGAGGWYPNPAARGMPRYHHYSSGGGYHHTGPMPHARGPHPGPRRPTTPCSRRRCSEWTTTRRTTKTKTSSRRSRRWSETGTARLESRTLASEARAAAQAPRQQCQVMSLPFKTLRVFFLNFVSQCCSDCVSGMMFIDESYLY